MGDGCRLNRGAYEQLIREDREWLRRQPRTLEAGHIDLILAASTEHEYDCGLLRARLSASEARVKEMEAAAKKMFKDAQAAALTVRWDAQDEVLAARTLAEQYRKGEIVTEGIARLVDEQTARLTAKLNESRTRSDQRWALERSRAALSASVPAQNEEGFVRRYIREAACPDCAVSGGAMAVAERVRDACSLVASDWPATLDDALRLRNKVLAVDLSALVKGAAK